eukprot:TRINITY_DN64369_c0_g1_i3.p1 TRINITY_DN64369_c0_g1~~TRINITY_DN64369_c0_g1_i3.p1  ORF type:complete len:173 (+),score=18.45 TRINITY_DN64369_c0_g1_i3:88-606(+)
MPQRRDKAVQVLLKKTKLCRSFQDGVDCPRGKKCSFAHSEDELRGPPDLSYTRLCLDFQNGHCRHGGWCSFAHSGAALRQRPQVQRTAASAWVDEDFMMHTKSKPLPRISYRFPEVIHPESLESLLDWDPAHAEVLHICGHRLSRRNTFLTIDRNLDYINLLQRSHSWPALT